MSKSWSVDGVTSAGYEDMHGMSFCLVGTEKHAGFVHEDGPREVGSCWCLLLACLGVRFGPRLGQRMGLSLGFKPNKNNLKSKNKIQNKIHYDKCEFKTRHK